MKVFANRSFSYARTQYEKGDPIEMPERDAKLLEATGRVVRDRPQEQAAAGTSKPEEKRSRQPKPERQQAPEQPPVQADDDDTKGRKRKSGYKRRDLTAEDRSEHEDD
ncbi:hypothetical protein [Caballeronia sp. LZ035]|uniref:hypothetical protein n=1 Tax=Caballeronia sp. LZ035 TaxID=3038568 RepID=UPI002862E7EF|nr:hypothetical protein [Caballeronia sp. LZ035]MDR5757898.1 hypothetical protein [Caballeronia sp. LZ035]